MLVVEPDLINSVFSSFCKSLYSFEFPSNLTDMDVFLQDQDFPDMSTDAIDQLNCPLTKQELTLALQNMQNNKAPGTDGFPVESFKAFHNQLILLLHDVYVESQSNGSYPFTLRQASISLLLKKCKDPELCTSFRPISLMNVGTKVNSY